MSRSSRSSCLWNRWSDRFSRIPSSKVTRAVVGGGEPHSLVRRAGGKAQGGGQRGLARARVIDQQHVFPAFEVLAAQQLSLS